MKSLALMFSGQPRNVIKTFKTGFLPNLYEANQDWRIDVYIHMWFDPNWINQPLHSSAGYYASEPIESTLVMDTVKAYSPEAMRIDPPMSFDEKNYNSHRAELIKPSNSLSSMFSKMRCQQLLEEYGGDSQYDLAISTRFDWQLTSPIVLDNFLNDSINVHKDVHPATNDAIQVGMCIGRPHLVKIWNELFNNVDNYFNKGIVFCDEQLYDAHMKANNIHVNRTEIPYHILRK